MKFSDKHVKPTLYLIQHVKYIIIENPNSKQLAVFPIDSKLNLLKV